MTCQTKDCTAEATGGVSINIPATGVITPHEPIKFILGLELCEKHALEFDCGDFLQLNPQIQQLVRRLCKLDNKVPPDFSRAYSRHIPYNSNDWKLHQQANLK